MARLSILDRFRPAGAPGPAGVVGIPAADSIGPATELAPVFAALADDVAACSELVATAKTQAEGTLSHARERAGALLAQAQLDVPGVQADAAARVTERAAEQDAALLAQAQGDADALKRSGTALLLSTAQKVIDAMFAEYLGKP